MNMNMNTPAAAAAGGSWAAKAKMVPGASDEMKKRILENNMSKQALKRYRKKQAEAELVAQDLVVELPGDDDNDNDDDDAEDEEGGGPVHAVNLVHPHSSTSSTSTSSSTASPVKPVNMNMNTMQTESTRGLAETVEMIQFGSVGQDPAAVAVPIVVDAITTSAPPGSAAARLMQHRAPIAAAPAATERRGTGPTHAHPSKAQKQTQQTQQSQTKSTKAQGSTSTLELKHPEPSKPSEPSSASTTAVSVCTSAAVPQAQGVSPESPQSPTSPIQSAINVMTKVSIAKNLIHTGMGGRDIALACQNFLWESSAQVRTDGRREGGRY
jgi:hypothetical protein